jgi:superoxide dismutase, Cu-Zn family
MPIKKLFAAVGTCAALCFIALGLRGLDAAQHDEKKAGGEVTKAIAQLHAASGSEVHGTVVFTKSAAGIHVHAEISGLSPGEHGFHIHEYGVWSKDGMSSGGHFNPTMAPHGGIDSKKRHVGDLGNITANSNGNATLDVDDSLLSFHGAHSIIGRGVVVHEKADDLKTPPSGNAGARLAVGVVGIAKP